MGGFKDDIDEIDEELDQDGDEGSDDEFAFDDDEEGGCLCVLRKSKCD